MKRIKNILFGIKNKMFELGKNNEGIGVVEIILILVVLIGLVVIFRDELTTIINNIFTRIVNDSNAL